MTTTTENHQKYLINCQEGANYVERATISFLLAVTASKTSEAAVFIPSAASQLCVKGGANGLVSEGLEPISDLIEGVEIDGAPRTMALLAGGAKLLA